RLGDRGQPGAAIRYGGESVAKSLSMHPPHTGFSRVCYFLDRRAQTVTAKVCLSEHDKRTKPKATRFAILGDGQVLWQSPAVAEHGTAHFTSRDVSQVTVLELRTYVEAGDSTGSHAVWLDPFVAVKPASNPRPQR